MGVEGTVSWDSVIMHGNLLADISQKSLQVKVLLEKIGIKVSRLPDIRNFLLLKYFADF